MAVVLELVANPNRRDICEQVFNLLVQEAGANDIQRGPFMRFMMTPDRGESRHFRLVNSKLGFEGGITHHCGYWSVTVAPEEFEGDRKFLARYLNSRLEAYRIR